MSHQPVGIWQFLTPLDVIQAGDLGRCRNGCLPLDHDWSVVEEDTSWYINGKTDTVVGLHVPANWEFIRPIDGTAVEIPTLLTED